MSPICPDFARLRVRGGDRYSMLSQMAPFYIIGGIIALSIFAAAVAAEGRGAHILRLWLESGSRQAVTTLREEALVGDVERDPNNLNLVGHLGAAERRYTELDARRVRAEEHANA